MDTGFIHIYYGNGKGKTTAAVGLAIRCAGRGGQVWFAQFLKAGNTGELTIFSRIPEITVWRAGGPSKFTSQMTAAERLQTAARQNRLWRRLLHHCHEAPPDLLVLDELLVAMSLGFIPEKEIIRFFHTKPPQTEIVLTGHTPSRKLLAAADYISQITAVKHPFTRGIPARIGIEK